MKTTDLQPPITNPAAKGRSVQGPRPREIVRTWLVLQTERIIRACRADGIDFADVVDAAIRRQADEARSEPQRAPRAPS